VKLSKLLKKLKRDLSASPQKAAALGVMVLVALYFWAPLVMKFVGAKGKDKKIAVAQVILPTAPLVTNVAAHPAIDTAHWDRIRETLAQEQLMTAATYQAQWQNPFRRAKHSKAAQEPTEPEDPTQLNTPANANQSADDSAAKARVANLVVSSLLITKRDRAAVIAGVVYRVGDVLDLGAPNGEPQLELRVSSIDETGIYVDHQGNKLRIERAKTRLSPGAHVRPQ
jgi:hypothetical protein